MIKYLAILIFLFNETIVLKSQDSIINNDTLAESPNIFLQNIEDSLFVYFSALHTYTQATEKKECNKKIETALNLAFTDTSSFYYPFNNVIKLGKIYSPDSLFRLYTWNLAYQGGIYEYFCYLQYFDKAKKHYRIIPLTDKPGIKLNPDSIYTAQKWYGALYYDIIKVVSVNRTYYTLLGLDFNNLFTQKKIIEVLHFDKKGNPVFGAPLFMVKGDVKNRIIFEYSARVVMHLGYDKKTSMIVFDHLSPSQAKYTGKYEFYGPDFSYDAFVFKNAMWVFTEDVDARNR